MKKELRTILLKYGITIAVGLAIALIYYFSKDASELKNEQLYRVLADAFTIPGIFMVMFGLIIFASNEGALDGISYVFHYAARTLIPFGRLKKAKNYAEYKEERASHNIHGYGFMFFVGIAFCIIALIFIYMFHNY